MISFDLLVSFASAARHLSFARAARELGHSPSAVAKNVGRLEAQLGVRLFHRTTRQVTLSPDGEAIYDVCRRILEDVESLEASVAGIRASPRGTLRIDVPVTYGRDVVLPVLAGLLAEHPELRVDVRFSDEVTDIIRDGLDAAVRIGQLADSRLVARTFDQQVIGTYASPGYLADRGNPRTPDDLPNHRCLLFRMPSSGRDRGWQFRHGKRGYVLQPEGGVRLGDGEALVRAGASGLGLIQVPEYMARRDVESGALVEVLASYRPDPLPISLVYPSHHHVPLRTRILAEALMEAGLARSRSTPGRAPDGPNNPAELR